MEPQASGYRRWASGYGQIRVGGGQREIQCERLAEADLMLGQVKGRSTINIINVDRDIEGPGRPLGILRGEREGIVAGLLEGGSPGKTAGFR